MCNSSSQSDQPKNDLQSPAPLRLPSFRDQFPPQLFPPQPSPPRLPSFISSPYNNLHSTPDQSSHHPAVIPYGPSATLVPAPAPSRPTQPMSPLVPPDFDDLRRYSLGTIPVTLDPNQPSRPPTERPPPHLRHRSSSSMSALPSRRHSSPYFVPERQARSLSVVSEAQLTFQQSTSSPKAFQCHFCDYATDPKYDRDRHARLHTGERPYSCSFCVSTFARSDARRRHEQSCPVAHEQQPSSSDSNHFPPPACPKLTSTPFLP